MKADKFFGHGGLEKFVAHGQAAQTAVDKIIESAKPTIKKRFRITIEAPADTTFAPGVDDKFLAAEICQHALKLWTFYSAGGPPDVEVKIA